MTDNEIIKALKECLTEPCSEQAYINAARNALDLINRQKANAEGLTNAVKYLNEQLSSARAEAVKEFAERFLKKVYDNHYVLSDRNNSKDYGMFTIGIEQAVNETKEEKVGDTK